MKNNQSKILDKREKVLSMTNKSLQMEIDRLTIFISNGEYAKAFAQIEVIDFISNEVGNLTKELLTLSEQS